MYTEAAEAAGKWESRGCWRDFQAMGESRFLTFPPRVFSTAFRAADCFTIVDPTPESVFRDSRSATDVWLPVAAEVNAESVFAVVVAPVMPGSPSGRSSVPDNTSKAASPDAA